MIWLECKSSCRNAHRIFQINERIFWSFGGYLLANREKISFQWCGEWSKI